MSLPFSGGRGQVREGRARSFFRLIGRRHGAKQPVWLVIPAIVLLTIVVLIPALIDLYISVLKVNVQTISFWLTAPFVGLQNYWAALTTQTITASSAVQALGLSVGFAVLVTVITAPIGFLVAVAVHNNFRGRGILRSLFLVPFVIPTVVTALAARLAFLNGTGLVDQTISFLHIGSRNTYWLIGPNVFWAMVLTEVWAVWPFVYVMMLAGLSSLNQEVFEASAVDGAGYLAKMRHIVIPQLRPLIFLVLLLSTIHHLGNFTLPFVLFGEPPPPGASVLPVDIYYRAFQDFDYSIAAATALLMVIVVAIPGYLYLRMTRLGDER